MQYFSDDYLEFFKELAANNHKDWFDENRKRYEKSVKDPFKNFIADLIAESQKMDPSIKIEAKDAIFRINRDIRFSKDKTPYKLDRSAIISSGGRKDHSVPGFYLAFGPEHLTLGGGAYFLKPDQLEKVRRGIMNESKAFDKLISEKAFKAYYGEIQGEENKRLPKEFQEAAEANPILFKKQFYFMHHRNPEGILDKNLMKNCIDHFKAAQPIQQFLKSKIM